MPFLFLSLYQKHAMWPAIETWPCALAWKWVVSFALLKYYGSIPILRFFLITLRHLVHQMCCNVVHCNIFYWDCLQGSDQVFVGHRQVLEQSHDDVFVSHGYIQTNDLIWKCLDFVDMVQQIVALLHMKNLWQTKWCWINSSSYECCKGSFTSMHVFHKFDIHKLVVHQIEVDDGPGIFYASLILLQHFRIHIGRWKFLGFISNVPKIYECQWHFDFELPNIRISFIEFVNDYNGLALKWWHHMLGYTFKTIKLVFSWPTINPTKLKNNLLHS